VTFVRTVLGDVEPADLGVTYAHEHLVIDGGPLVERDPSFALDSVDDAVHELAPARALGLGTIVDAMPCDLGRNARKLAEVSRRSGVHVVASTGLHVADFYGVGHWGATASEDDLSARFVAEIAEGIDDGDPADRQAEHRAGVIKVGGSRDMSSDRDRRVFRAAAAAQRATGCPILTHCTDGRGGLEQLELLVASGADPDHVVLSHTDKVVERGYHRELLASGASVEYDQAFRWPADGENGTLALVGWMIEDGFGDRVMLGLDAARRSYWRVHGGAPGWTYLLGPFSAMLAERGIDDEARRRILVETPARVYAFAATSPGRGAGQDGR
jgi:predicted metal-dependent phosphotriesterase family hydrolase